MSKEEVEVLEAPVEEEQVQEEPVETPEEAAKRLGKAALMAFILGLVAFLLQGWFGGLVGIICGAIALGKAKKAKGVDKQPGKIFRILGLVFGILGLVFGIINLIETILAVFVLIPLTVLGVGVAAVIANWPAIAAAINEAAGQQILLALLAL